MDVTTCIISRYSNNSWLILFLYTFQCILLPVTLNPSFSVLAPQAPVLVLINLFKAQNVLMESCSPHEEKILSENIKVTLRSSHTDKDSM